MQKQHIGNVTHLTLNLFSFVHPPHGSYVSFTFYSGAYVHRGRTNQISCEIENCKLLFS